MAVAGGSGAGGLDGRVVGQEADGREPDGAGTVGQGGSDSQEGGMAGCMRARWQLLGVVGVAWSSSSRWCAGRGQIRGKRQLEAR